MIQTFSVRSSIHLWLRLRLWLWLFCHSSVGHRAAFHGGSSVLVRYWLRGVWWCSCHWFSVSRGYVCKALRFLVATLWTSFNGGRLLQREVRSVGMGLGSMGPSSRRGLNDRGVLLGVAALSLGGFCVALQANTKYTLTGKFIQSWQEVVFAQTLTAINNEHKQR